MNRTFGRSVLITGASAGIGSALAASFARHGDRIVAVARRGHLLRNLEKELRSEGRICHAFTCDLGSERSIGVALKKGERLAGPYDVIINNAGVTYFKSVLETSRKKLDEVLDVNLRGLALVAMKVLPSMVKRRRGLVINILSYAAKTTYTGSSVYSASKAGGEAFMNVLREEVRDKNIKVMNVYPGAVRTPMWHPKHQKKYGDRMMTPEDVADLIYSASVQPASLMVEELVLRPQEGDLRL